MRWEKRQKEENSGISESGAQGMTGAAELTIFAPPAESRPSSETASPHRPVSSSPRAQTEPPLPAAPGHAPDDPGIPGLSPRALEMLEVLNALLDSLEDPPPDAASP